MGFWDWGSGRFGRFRTVQDGSGRFAGAKAAEVLEAGETGLPNSEIPLRQKFYILRPLTPKKFKEVSSSPQAPGPASGGTGFAAPGG